MNSPTRGVLSLKRSQNVGPSVEDRLHKVLANAGLGSRRMLEERIQAGEVRVNAHRRPIGFQRESRRSHRDGRQAFRRHRRQRRTRAGFDVPQTRRRGHHARRSRRPPDRLRTTAAAERRALDRRRPARYQHHRFAAPHHRWRARPQTDAPERGSRTRIHLPRPRRSAGRGAGKTARAASNSKTVRPSSKNSP